MPSYPEVNGLRPDYSSVEINASGRTIVGVKSISYGHGLEPGEVRGTGAQLNGRTRGQYKAKNCSMTLYRAEADELREALGAGYMERAFEIVIHIAERDQPTATDRLVGARIVDESDEMEEGSEALTTKFELHVMTVLKNGVAAITNMNV